MSQLEEPFPLSRSACRELQKVPSSPDMKHYAHTGGATRNTCYGSATTPDSSLKEFHIEANEWHQYYQVSTKGISHGDTKI